MTTTVLGAAVASVEVGGAAVARVEVAGVEGVVAPAEGDGLDAVVDVDASLVGCAARSVAVVAFELSFGSVGVDVETAAGVVSPMSAALDEQHASVTTQIEMDPNLIE